MLCLGNAVEHSYNCMVLLCRLFLGLSRHYTKNPYKVRIGSLACKYSDDWNLVGTVDVSGFSYYVILATFCKSAAYGTEKPIIYIDGNKIVLQSTGTGFNPTSAISVNYIIMGNS